MAHSKFQKRRGDLAQAMSDIDQKMSMTSDPEVIAGLKARKKAYQTMLNTLEGMSEKEYSKLTDSEKRQINTLHRELALTRDEINTINYTSRRQLLKKLQRIENQLNRTLRLVTLKAIKLLQNLEMCQEKKLRNMTIWRLKKMNLI